MSTIVPMPVRVKPPPAESGETISPGCAALAVTTPAKARGTTEYSKSYLGPWHLGAGRVGLAATGGELSRGGGDRGTDGRRICCVAMPLDAATAGAASPPGPGRAAPPPSEKIWLGRIHVRLRDREAGAEAAVVEAGDDRPFSTAPFLDQHLGQGAGDLGRDRPSPGDGR